MFSIPINIAEFGSCRYDAAFPKLEFGSDEQKTNKDGVLQWTVVCLWRAPEQRTTEIINITVPMKQDPSEVLQPGDEIGFKDFKLYCGETNGKKWYSFSAAGIGKRK